MKDDAVERCLDEQLGKKGEGNVREIHGIMGADDESEDAYSLGEYEVQPDMPAYPYTSVAVAFSKALYRRKFGRIKTFLAPDVKLTLFNKHESSSRPEEGLSALLYYLNWKQELIQQGLFNPRLLPDIVFSGVDTHKSVSGAKEVMAYFFQWMKKAGEKFPVDVSVKWFLSLGRPAVFLDNKMMVLFFIKDGKVQDIMFGESSVVSDFSRPGVLCVGDLSSSFSPSHLLPEDFFPFGHQTLPETEPTNVFSLSGAAVKEYVDGCISGSQDFNESDFFSILQEIKPKEGDRLELFDGKKMSSERVIYQSYLFIRVKNGHKKDVEASRFRVSATAMGAWHLYLMVRPDVLIRRKEFGKRIDRFILSVKDLREIKAVRDSWAYPFLIRDGVFLPSVSLAKDGKSADVYCCYWDRISGLVREHIEVLFHADGTAEYKKLDNFRLLLNFAPTLGKVGNVMYD